MELNCDLEPQKTEDEIKESDNSQINEESKELKLKKTFEKVFCGNQIICIKGNFPRFFNIQKLIISQFFLQDVVKLESPYLLWK